MPDLRVIIHNTWSEVTHKWVYISINGNDEPGIEPQGDTPFENIEPQDIIKICTKREGSDDKLKCGIQFRSDCEPFQACIQKFLDNGQHWWELTNFSSTQTDVNVSVGPDVQ
jgi:hypothetical protein